LLNRSRFTSSRVARVAVACVEMCELSELSELSPGADHISAETGRSFGLRATISERPVCHPAFVSSWPGIARADVRSGVAFPELSKLLNQEGALGAPCLRGDFCSPQARPRGAQECYGKAYPLLLCHITVCDHRSSRWQALMFPGGGGRCTGRAHRCKAKQGLVVRRPRRLNLNPTIVRFLNRVDRVREFLW